MSNFLFLHGLHLTFVLEFGLLNLKLGGLPLHVTIVDQVETY